jgi:glycosyltransferase involved in cell wall biosynthesis
MRVLFLADVFSGCTWIRCVVPGHELSKQGHSVRVRVGTFDKADMLWADAIVLQRMWDGLSLDLVRWARHHGKLTVYDLDDDLWTIGPENSASTFWQHNSHKATQVIQECDRVVTTGEYLADVLREMNHDVRVVPNALPADWKHTGEKHDGLVIGWAGGNSHKADMLSVAEALYSVLDERDVTMEVTCDWLDHPKVQEIEPVDISTYHHLISRFDIGIAPLIDDHFNRCKSSLKPLEYAGCGIPWVASRVGPYAADLTHGDGGYLVDTEEDWRRHLLRLVDDARHRKEMGRRARRWASGWRIDRVSRKWVDVLTP